MSIYDPTFSSPQVAAAIGLTHDNFRAYLSRKGWRIVGKAPAANARGHLFTIYDVLGYALARELVDIGVDPETAFLRAMLDFAHTGDPDRAPGEVYPVETHGMTIFAYSPGAAAARCIASKMVRDPIELLTPPMHAPARSVILIDLNDLRERVFHALGLDARDYV